MNSPATSCELCQADGGQVVWRDASCRVLRVADPDYPGFLRVVWHAHVAEMSDLAGADRRHLMRVVCAAEVALRGLMRPDKINLASLGNQVAHLHWHVIARFRDDRHYPQPIWAAAQRAAAQRTVPGERALHDAIVAALAEDEGGGP